MARDFQSLEDSKEIRQKLLQRFEGKIPESIMVYNRADKAIDLTADRRWNAVKEGGIAKLNERLDSASDSNMIVNKEAYKQKFKSGFGGSRGTEDDPKSVSRFPQNICRNVIKFYTEEGAIIVDPFAGHNSRMESAFRTKRHYYGQDLCHEFMVDNFKIRDILLEKNKEKLFISEEPTIIDLTEGDSRHLPWPDKFGDFTITSPPYWGIEFYGPEKEQLGTGDGGKTYESFLEGMQQVAYENFRVLKPGAFCCYFINDFIVDGKFFDYHGDTKNLLVKAGFIHHDLIVIDLGHSLRSVFFAESFKAKRIPKRHEFAVVVRKPK